MAKNLLVVESPAKSRTLKKFLGKDFNIMATIGHIRDLPKAKLGVDTENGFKVSYTLIKGKSGVIKKLKEAAKKSESIFLAPDPDREGEAIAWHVAQQLKQDDKITRVTFNEITKQAVTSALRNTRDINLNLVNAQQARRVLDRLVGYKVSPFLWKTITYGLSAGRVQSVALRIICERENEITAFKPKEYWTIEVLLEDDRKAQFTARLAKIDNEKADISTKEETDRIISEFGSNEFQVSSIKKAEKKRYPSPPFITSTLQQEAARSLYFTPKKTMMLAQNLYEGVELGDEGPTGLITYMRTDSVRLADSAVKSVRKYIESAFGNQYLPQKPVKYKTKKGSQDAHEAIRPTSMELSPESVKRYLSKDQYRLYSLIWDRFLACQMSPAVYDTTTVEIESGRFLFSAHVQVLRFDGFLKVYQETRENGQNGENGLVDFIPELKEGDRLRLIESSPSQHFTKPPPRYSQASLVKTLEAEGIGRPSTYASILSTLLDRKYVEIKERRLHPTELGQTVKAILIEHFPEIFDIKFTAEMENELDEIEEGRANWQKVVRDFYRPFDETLKNLEEKQGDIKKSLTQTTDEICDKCGSPMVIKWGRHGRFLACSAYPECKNTRPLENSREEIMTDERCDECGAAMVIKTGRFGRFLACSNYPECKFTKPLSTGVKCPREGCSGEIVEKKSRKGKVFYGCSNYPKCDFVSWSKPVAKKCPECGHDFMYEKYSKTSGEYLSCPNCRHRINVEKETEDS